MDIVALQEAKKAQKRIGNLNELETKDKSDTVSAINEVLDQVETLKDKIEDVPDSSAPIVIEHLIPNVQTGEAREMVLPFTGSCFIKGIKCTGNEFTGDFSLKIFTKKPSEGGTYVYYSGIVNNVLWDIMDIPFTDESGERTVYTILENKGVTSSFLLQIYVTKG